MRTTIDRSGRLVVPKVLRDALQLGDGGEVEVVARDGVIQISPVLAPIKVVETTEGAVAVPVDPLPPLTDDAVRDTLESVRR